MLIVISCHYKGNRQQATGNREQHLDAVACVVCCLLSFLIFRRFCRFCHFGQCFSLLGQLARLNSSSQISDSKRNGTERILGHCKNKTSRTYVLPGTLVLGTRVWFATDTNLESRISNPKVLNSSTLDSSSTAIPPHPTPPYWNWTQAPVPITHHSSLITPTHRFSNATCNGIVFCGSKLLTLLCSM
jgi:hypothetical protein